MQCGKELPAQAHFCMFCGTRAAAADDAGMLDAEPTLVLKPHFALRTIALPTLFLWGFFTVWCCLFCGGFSMVGVGFLEWLLGIKLPEGITFIFWGSAAFVGVPIVAVSRYWAKCRNTEYRIYPDRIETVYEGRSRTVDCVSLSQVTGLEFKRCGVRPELKLGTITIHKPGTVKVNNQLQGAMVLETIENGEELFERLKLLTTGSPPFMPPQYTTPD